MINRESDDDIKGPDRNRLVVDRPNIVVDAITKSVVAPEHHHIIDLSILQINIRVADQLLQLIDQSHLKDIDHTNRVHMSVEESGHRHLLIHQQHRHIQSILHLRLLKLKLREVSVFHQIFYNVCLTTTIL